MKGHATTSQAVLVIDDDEDLLHAVAEVLRDQGYIVVTATDGESAIALLGQVVPSLIVCDLSMPGMDGLAFIGMDKKTTAVRRIPIVLMTGADRPGALPHGCVAMLPKPFLLKDLLAIVAQHALR